MRIALAVAAVVAAVAPATAADVVVKTYPVTDLVYPVVPPHGSVLPAAPRLAPPVSYTVPLPSPVMPVMPAAAAGVPQYAVPVPAMPVVPPPVMPVAALPGVNAKSNAESLARVITTTVNPHSWATVGGVGQIRVELDKTGASLVVTQTADVHARVAELLATLHKVHEKSTTQVRVQMRVVEVGDDFCERVGVDFNAPHDPKKGVKTMTAAEVREFLTTVQGDRRANTLSAPVMVLTDNQTGTLRIGEAQVFQTGLTLVATPTGVERKPQHQTVETGITTTLTPRVSADGRVVTLRLNYQHAAVNPSPVVLSVATSDKPGAEALAVPCVDVQTIESTLALPDGATGVLVGPAMRKDVRAEFGPPVASRIPYVNRLFKTTGVGAETRRQLILLTPNVMWADACALPAPCAEKCAVECAPPKPASEVDVLMAGYRKACADGKTEDAMRLAMKALALDPKCFAAK